MLKSLMGKRPVREADVFIAFGAALLAVYKAFDTHRAYQAEQAKNQENDK